MQQISSTTRTLSLNKSNGAGKFSLKIRRGDVFKWFDESGVEHNWFVLTHEHNGQHLIANITSKRSDTNTPKKVDEDCVILKSQCKDFAVVTKDSFVSYSTMRLLSVEFLSEIMHKDGECKCFRAPMYLIDRMAGAVAISTRAQPRFVNHYKSIKHL
jgi:hypothetical protein